MSFRKVTVKLNEHYQLFGSVALRIFHNAAKIKEGILKHRQGNPFSNNMRLMNIVSNMTLPEEVKPDSLHRDDKGAAKFKEFVSSRMIQSTAEQSFLGDPIRKRKLKVFSTCHKKIACKVKDKLVKLREDRQLLARFLIIQQSRPELGENLGVAGGVFSHSQVSVLYRWTVINSTQIKAHS